MAEADPSYEISMAVRLLLQAGREMQAASARRMGLRITDVQAMDVVTASGNEISPSDLTSRLGIRSASTSALIDRMVAAGHMTRTAAAPETPRPGRRRVTVSATPQARAEVREVLSQVNSDFRELAAALSPDQQTTVLAFLQDAHEILRSYAATAQDASDTRGTAVGGLEDSPTRPVE